jgi:hypothetical protein
MKKKLTTQQRKFLVFRRVGLPLSGPAGGGPGLTPRDRMHGFMRRILAGFPARFLAHSGDVAQQAERTRSTPSLRWKTSMDRRRFESSHPHAFGKCEFPKLEKLAFLNSPAASVAPVIPQVDNMGKLPVGGLPSFSKRLMRSPWEIQKPSRGKATLLEEKQVRVRLPPDARRMPAETLTQLGHGRPTGRTLLRGGK